MAEKAYKLSELWITSTDDSTLNIVIEIYVSKGFTLLEQRDYNHIHILIFKMAPYYVLINNEPKLKFEQQ